MKKILIDLDGTLAKYDKWRGHEHIGEPITDAIKCVKMLYYAGYELILFSTRLNPDIDLIEPEKPPRLIITNWLKENHVLHMFSDMTYKKIPCCAIWDSQSLKDSIDIKKFILGLNKNYVSNSYVKKRFIINNEKYEYVILIYDAFIEVNCITSLKDPKNISKEIKSFLELQICSDIRSLGGKVKKFTWKID